MSDTPAGPGWWQASDDRWYPPESHPDQRDRSDPSPSDSAVDAHPASGHSLRAGLIRYAIVAAAGLVVIVLMALVLFNSDSVDDATVPPDGAPGGVPPGDDPSDDVPVAVGTPGDIGAGWQLTVVEVDLDADARVVAEDRVNESPETGMRYIVVTSTLTYAGSDPTSLFSGTRSVSGSDGVDRVAPEQAPVPPAPALDTGADLAPGESVTGNEIYAVGETETGFLMHSVSENGHTVTFSLE